MDVQSLPPPAGQSISDSPADSSQSAVTEGARLYVWVKGLEGKVNNLLREMNVIKNDFIKKTGQFRKELKTLNDDLLEVKHEQGKILQKMDLMIKELQKTAGAEEVMVLKKYVDFWNPLNFVTQRDVERIVEQKLEEKHHGSHPKRGMS